MNAIQYRKTCTLRRNGHVVEERKGDAWVKVNLDDFQKLRAAKKDEKPIAGINRAKRYIRKTGARFYNL